jgi:transposase-like protein
MARRKRRKFAAEFKADAARLVTSGGKTIAEVTKQFDLTETALREWVRRAQADAGRGPPDALTTAERAELIELRKRLKRVEMERDILKKATAFVCHERTR